MTNTKLSESEEMYLATIARIQEADWPGPAPLSRLADELGVLPVSANQMVRKLEEANLVVYLPYKGVELTEKGLAEALRILRHRRLWEVFLVKNLDYTPEEADLLACRLEHTLPPEAAERLADFLGNPVESPSNKPIPPVQALTIHQNFIPLSQIGLDEIALVGDIAVEAAARDFLARQGIHCGARVHLAGSGDRGDYLIRTDSGRTILLSQELTQAIRIKREQP
jgi:DtxR family transcriptional regulator, Mn-dependent transcriptional regulator